MSHTRRAWARRPFLRSFAALLAAAACCGTAAGRDLPNIDRLGESPPLAAYAARGSPQVRDPALQLHSRLGLPTFAWGQRGGRIAELAQAARVPATAAPEQAARAYLRALGELYALPAEQANRVPAHHVQSLPNGGALVKFRNRIDGIEVFNEEAAVLLSPERELVAIGGYLSGGEAAAALAIGPEPAIAIALADWSFAASIEPLLVRVDTRDEHQYFDLPAGTTSGDGSQLLAPVRVKRVLYRLPSSLRPAWYVEVQVRDGLRRDSDAYSYVIAADDGSLLFRNNLTAHAAYTYRVYAETTGAMLPLPSPLGRNAFPHPTGTPDGYQPPFGTSSLVSLQNVPFSHNDPWLPANATQTTGNNVDAYADLVPPDGFSAGDVRAVTTSPGVFDYAHNPALQPGANGTQVMAAVVNLFYLNNWLHDWYYDAGFDEAAGNAQNDNLGRGGVAGDAIRAEAQDSSDRNNANMAVPSDGLSPRMQMFVFDAVRSVTLTINAQTAPAPGAVFGPVTFNTTAGVVTTAPANGCSAIAGIPGKIALIDRGSCSFKLKVANAQAAGAVGVIIADNGLGLVPFMPDDVTVVTTITIGSVLVSQADGNAIKTLIAGGPVTGTVAAVKDPDRDGTLDNTIVAHEWAHYLSNRLVGNANGLFNQQGGGMGEGWSDFHAMLLLVKSTDAALPNNANFGGTYANGAYVSSGPLGVATDGAYYGGRRYPYSRNTAKNPLTFQHITNGVPLPGSPVPHSGADGSTNAEVHNTGEVWASMLWECYSNLLNDTPRLTFGEAQDRMKRYLVLGLKLTPVAPTFVEARDALLAGMLEQDSADYVQCLKGFTKRGLGLSAVAPDRFDVDNLGVVESFGEGGAMAIVSVGVSDAPGWCDNDGYLDNGETGTVTVALRNYGTQGLSTTTGNVTSSNPKLTFPSGNALTIPATAAGQAVTVSLPVHLAGAAGIELAALTVSVDDPAMIVTHPVVSAGNPFWVNVDEKANDATSDNFETNHDVWSVASLIANPLPSEVWRRITVPGVGHRWLGPDVGRPQATVLYSPPLTVAPAGNFVMTFSHRFSFEFDGLGNYDGGKILLTTDGGQSFFDIGVAAVPGYNGTLLPGTQNPLAGAAAYVQTNAAYPGFQTVTVNLGATFAGQVVQIAFASVSDDFAGAPGWEIDDVAFSGITNKPFASWQPNAGVCYSVTVQQGAPQFAPVSTQFGTPLKALVKTGAGTPVPGVSVQFTAPGAGASATFGGASMVLTDGSGIATAPSLTANATIGFYAVTGAVGAQSVSFNLVNTATKPIDMDANNAYDALTDGLLIMRHLLGVSGAPLIAGALGSGATRNTDTAVAQYAAAIVPVFDVDGNGTQDPFTDGVMIMRYLFGYRDTALTQGALGGGATRNAAQIEAYIASLMP